MSVVPNSKRNVSRRETTEALRKVNSFSGLIQIKTKTQIFSPIALVSDVQLITMHQQIDDVSDKPVIIAQILNVVNDLSHIIFHNRQNNLIQMADLTPGTLKLISPVVCESSQFEILGCWMRKVQITSEMLVPTI